MLKPRSVIRDFNYSLKLPSLSLSPRLYDGVQVQNFEAKVGAIKN